MAENSSRKNLKPPEKRVRFPKGKKTRPEEHIDEGALARRKDRSAAAERTRLRHLSIAKGFEEDDKDVYEETYENDGNRTEDGIQIEAFNLDRDKEEGYFDADGNFVEYVRVKEDKDAWLDSIETNPMEESYDCGSALSRLKLNLREISVLSQACIDIVDASVEISRASDASGEIYNHAECEASSVNRRVKKAKKAKKAKKVNL